MEGRPAKDGGNPFRHPREKVVELIFIVNTSKYAVRGTSVLTTRS